MPRPSQTGRRRLTDTVDQEEFVRSAMTASTVDQRATGTNRRLRRLTVLGATLAVLATGACGTAKTEAPAAVGAAAQGSAAVAAPAVFEDDQYLQNGKEFVDAAKWDAAAKVRIDLGEMFFKPKDVTLEAGKPYVIELANTGKVKHEYTADKFFPTVAFRKAEDSLGEYKAPMLKEAEVKAGAQLDLFLIPTTPGTYDIVCMIEGHKAAGMFGTITVTK